MQLVDIPTPGFHRVVHASDPESGLESIIAVHDVTLGPAVGGIRMWTYGSFDEALTDALRLGEGMTYKSAVAETGLGGGKSVIIGDSRTQKSEALFLAMGRFVDQLDGLYMPAEDVGTSTADLAIVGRATKHVCGLPRELGGSGDPSPFTARGVWHGMRAGLAAATGVADLKGRSVLVQGTGHVGGILAILCAEAGAQVTVADIDRERARSLAAQIGGKDIAPDEVIGHPCDVFAPCALGAILNDDSIPKLQTKVVAGAANNQLAEPHHAQALAERGIVYCPDYVINSGGIINIGVEVSAQGYSEERSVEKVTAIERVTSEVLAYAGRMGITTDAAALELAKQKLAAGRAV